MELTAFIGYLILAIIAAGPGVYAVVAQRKLTGAQTVQSNGGASESFAQAAKLAGDMNVQLLSRVAELERRLQLVEAHKRYHITLDLDVDTNAPARVTTANVETIAIHKKGDVPQ
jgi:hypothetical protein